MVGILEIIKLSIEKKEAKMGIFDFLKKKDAEKIQTVEDNVAVPLLKVSDDWLPYMGKTLNTLKATNNVKPQTCICCRKLHMVELLLAKRQSSLDPFLIKPPALTEFANGEGAVTFVLRDRQMFMTFFQNILAGDYEPDSVFLNGGFVVGLPAPEVTALSRLLDVHLQPVYDSIMLWHSMKYL